MGSLELTATHFVNVFTTVGVGRIEFVAHFDPILVVTRFFKSLRLASKGVSVFKVQVLKLSV